MFRKKMKLEQKAPSIPVGIDCAQCLSSLLSRLPSQRVLQKIVENLRQGGGLEPMAIQFPGRHLTALSFNSPSYYLVRGWRIYH